MEAEGIPLKAFGNWRAKFKTEPQPRPRKLLYRRGELSHPLSHSPSHILSHVTYRRASKRPHLNNTDRFLFVWLYRWFPSVLGAIAIVRPETIVRWHRAGFRAHWRWRSRNRVARPKVLMEVRTLIGEMSRANRLWGAPRIHGELLKLGFEVAQSTVARYMCRRFGAPSQGWRTFLSNHADGIVAIDLFILPTVAFQILYCLVILRHGRRFWVSFGVTSNPTAEWISRQITEAFPWDHAPQYLIRDRDGSYGSVFVRRLCAMGIRDRPIAPRSPWQNACVRDSLARSAGSAWTTSSCSVKRTCAGSQAPMLPTIMSRGPIDPWTRTPRSIAPFSASAPSHHSLSSAYFITNIAESNFRYTQAAAYRPACQQRARPRRSLSNSGSAARRRTHCLRRRVLP